MSRATKKGAKATFRRIKPKSKYDDTKRAFPSGRVGFRKVVLPSGRVTLVPIQEDGR